MLKPLQRQGKGRTQNLFSKGYLISCFYHVICGNDSVRPATEGHPPAGKGGVAINWGSNPQPSTRVNEQ
nr:MAG TPA: hypothetical protein [Caudoviricetes sp.]DAR51761.1 MAG TPA: hypothetical protein [Caudoviricetes sp.]